jgi:hypothetical protein
MADANSWTLVLLRSCTKGAAWLFPFPWQHIVNGNLGLRAGGFEDSSYRNALDVVAYAIHTKLALSCAVMSAQYVVSAAASLE